MNLFLFQFRFSCGVPFIIPFLACLPICLPACLSLTISICPLPSLSAYFRSSRPFPFPSFSLPSLLPCYCSDLRSSHVGRQNRLWVWPGPAAGGKWDEEGGEGRKSGKGRSVRARERGQNQLTSQARNPVNRFRVISLLLSFFTHTVILSQIFIFLTTTLEFS